MSELKYVPFEEESQEIKDKVTDYWTKRSDSFFEHKCHELKSTMASRWLKEITAQISGKVPSKDEDAKILDIGCGVGFFTVLLGKDGYDVTGIDLTQEMINKAKILIELNGPYRKELKAVAMDAEKLSFPDESFDVIVTRNLTWTLPHPVEAYKEWFRVLKKGGILLNFDAEYAKGAHNLSNQENLAHKMVSDDMKDECHKIYHMLTISTLDRPKWDEELLSEIGFKKIVADTNFADRIFVEKDEFYIPDRVFMIKAVK